MLYEVITGLFEQVLVDQAALAVALLRPGVGAVDVDGGEGIARQVAQQVAGLDAHHPQVVESVGIGFAAVV